MAEQRLFNVLQLAYTPLSNYDFVMVKGDAIIQQFINSGKLYVIAQRPVLTFENFYIDGDDPGNNHTMKRNTFLRTLSVAGAVFVAPLGIIASS